MQRRRRRIFVVGAAAFVFLVMWAPSTKAQTATLSGFVTDGSNGRPIEPADVVVQGGGRTRGASTNPDGLYIIAHLGAGRYAVQVSYVGYTTYRDTLDLSDGETRTLNVALRPTAEAMEEVLVESERTGGAARITAGQQIVRPADIERIPGPDVSADLASYLATLPGVVTTGDRGGQFFIRGGEPSQNLVQIDDILLYQPFHILGFYSAFPSDILQRVDLYAGGYGSEFGGRVSSVIDIASRNGNSRTYAGSASASPFISSLELEGPIFPNRLSLLASVRRSTVRDGASRYVDTPLPFDFGDTFVKLNGVITENSRASITALKTFDTGTLGEDDGGLPPEELHWTNDAIGLRFLMLPKVFSIMADLHVSYSRLQSSLGAGGPDERSSRIENTFVALDATYFGGTVDVQAGTSLRISSLNSALAGQYQNVELRSAQVPDWGTYLQLDFDLGHGLRIRPGARLQFFRVRFEPYLEPRLRVVWNHGIHEVSGAAGLYHQEIIGLSDRRDAASVFTVWTNIPRANTYQLDVRQGRPQTALHSLLGYRVSPAPWIDVSIEGYYKDLTNLFIPEWTAFPRLTTRLQPATGYSFGADARVEVRVAQFYGYVNYGMSSTRYRGEQAALKLWYGTESLNFRPPHDRRHQLNALLSTKVHGFDLSMRWEFGSGLPFSRPLGFDGFVLIDDVRKASDVPASRRVIYERPYNALLPTYHRLDVSVERTFQLGRASVTAVASGINVYDRRNIFYLDIFTLRRVDQLPFVPSLGLKVAFE